MAQPNDLPKLFQYIDQNAEESLKLLKNAIAFKSINTGDDQILNACDWVVELMTSYGIKAEIKPLSNDAGASLLPVILGTLFPKNCKNKPTVLIYSHLDVTNARQQDGWYSDPFNLFQKEQALYGRGVVIKASLIAWVRAIQAYKETEVEFPLNIMLVVECLGTRNSDGLKKFLLSEKENILDRVDYICISKGSWLQSDVPCLIQSVKGLCHFCIEIISSSRNLSRDQYSGLVSHPLKDLMYLLKNFSDEKGNLMVPDLNRDAEPLSDAEMNRYRTAISNTKASIDSEELEMLISQIALPTATICRIENSNTRALSYSSTIPGSVKAHIFIQIVPNQCAEKCFQRVKDHFNSVWTDCKSLNELKIYAVQKFSPWMADGSSKHQQVGLNSFKNVYTKEPCSIRNQYGLPIVNLFSQITTKDILVLPVNPGENYEVNEKLDVESYKNSIKICAAYLYNSANLPNTHLTEKESVAPVKPISKKPPLPSEYPNFSEVSSIQENTNIPETGRSLDPDPAPAPTSDGRKAKKICDCTEEERAAAGLRGPPSIPSDPVETDEKCPCCADCKCTSTSSKT